MGSTTEKVSRPIRSPRVATQWLFRPYWRRVRIHLGDRIYVSRSSSRESLNRQHSSGRLRFWGKIHCADGYWAGVELDLPHGQVSSGRGHQERAEYMSDRGALTTECWAHLMNQGIADLGIDQRRDEQRRVKHRLLNDGSLDGIRYFLCHPNRGLFVRITRCRTRAGYSVEDGRHVSFATRTLGKKFDDDCNMRLLNQRANHLTGLSRCTDRSSSPRLSQLSRWWESDSLPSGGTRKTQRVDRRSAAAKGAPCDTSRRGRRDCHDFITPRQEFQPKRNSQGLASSEFSSPESDLSPGRSSSENTSLDSDTCQSDSDQYIDQAVATPAKREETKVTTPADDLSTRDRSKKKEAAEIERRRQILVDSYSRWARKLERRRRRDQAITHFLDGSSTSGPPAARTRKGLEATAGKGAGETDSNETLLTSSSHGIRTSSIEASQTTFSTRWRWDDKSNSSVVLFSSGSAHRQPLTSRSLRHARLLLRERGMYAHAEGLARGATPFQELQFLRGSRWSLGGDGLLPAPPAETEVHPSPAEFPEGALTIETNRARVIAVLPPSRDAGASIVARAEAATATPHQIPQSTLVPAQRSKLMAPRQKISASKHFRWPDDTRQEIEERVRGCPLIITPRRIPADGTKPCSLKFTTVAAVEETPKASGLVAETKKVAQAENKQRQSTEAGRRPIGFSPRTWPVCVSPVETNGGPSCLEVVPFTRSVESDSRIVDGKSCNSTTNISRDNHEAPGCQQAWYTGSSEWQDLPDIGDSNTVNAVKKRASRVLSQHTSSNILKKTAGGESSKALVKADKHVVHLERFARGPTRTHEDERQMALPFIVDEGITAGGESSNALVKADKHVVHLERFARGPTRTHEDERQMALPFIVDEGMESARATLTTIEVVEIVFSHGPSSAPPRMNTSRSQAQMYFDHNKNSSGSEILLPRDARAGFDGYNPSPRSIGETSTLQGRGGRAIALVPNGPKSVPQPSKVRGRTHNTNSVRAIGDTRILLHGCSVPAACEESGSNNFGESWGELCRTFAIQRNSYEKPLERQSSDDNTAAIAYNETIGQAGVPNIGMKPIGPTPDTRHCAAASSNPTHPLQPIVPVNPPCLLIKTYRSMRCGKTTLKVHDLAESQNSSGIVVPCVEGEVGVVNQQEDHTFAGLDERLIGQSASNTHLDESPSRTRRNGDIGEPSSPIGQDLLGRYAEKSSSTKGPLPISPEEPEREPQDASRMACTEKNRDLPPASPPTCLSFAPHFLQPRPLQPAVVSGLVEPYTERNGAETLVEPGLAELDGGTLRVKPRTGSARTTSSPIRHIPSVGATPQPQLSQPPLRAPSAVRSKHPSRVTADADAHIDLNSSVELFSTDGANYDIDSDGDERVPSVSVLYWRQDGRHNEACQAPQHVCQEQQAFEPVADAGSNGEQCTRSSGQSDSSDNTNMRSRQRHRQRYPPPPGPPPSPTPDLRRGMVSPCKKDESSSQERCECASDEVEGGRRTSVASKSINAVKTLPDDVAGDDDAHSCSLSPHRFKAIDRSTGTASHDDAILLELSVVPWLPPPTPPPPEARRRRRRPRESSRSPTPPLPSSPFATPVSWGARTPSPLYARNHFAGGGEDNGDRRTSKRRGEDSHSSTKTESGDQPNNESRGKQDGGVLAEGDRNFECGEGREGSSSLLRGDRDRRKEARKGGWTRSYEGSAARRRADEILARITALEDSLDRVEQQPIMTPSPKVCGGDVAIRTAAISRKDNGGTSYVEAATHTAKPTSNPPWCLEERDDVKGGAHRINLPVEVTDNTFNNGRFSRHPPPPLLPTEVRHWSRKREAHSLKEDFTAANTDSTSAQRNQSSDGVAVPFAMQESGQSTPGLSTGFERWRRTFHEENERSRGEKNSFYFNLGQRMILDILE